MIACSFCGGDQTDGARYIFAGPTRNCCGCSQVEILAICSICVRLCEVELHLADVATDKRERELRRGKSVCDGWLYQGGTP